MFGRNLHYSLRTSRRSPGFTVIAILALALGIGANTAIFSVVYAALLRPLPYREPGRVLMIGEARHQYSGSPDSSLTAHSSYPDYLEWTRTAKSFESLAAFQGEGFTLDAGGEPKNIMAGQATPGFFPTLGVKLFLGRNFEKVELNAAVPHVAILTYGEWQSEFAGDPKIIGRSIRLDSTPVTIIGVLPRDFEFAPRSAPLWVPLHPGPDSATRRSLRWLFVIGRLAPGITPEQARAEMETINARLAREYPKENGSTVVVLGSLRDRIIGKIRPLLLVLLGAVGFVLLIACANVANLLITRSIGRRKEFAVRAALGASRGNLISQLVTETMLLSVVGAVCGLIGAHWGVRFLVAAMPEAQLRDMPYLRDAGMNLPVLAFLCAITLVTGMLFGVSLGLAAARLQLNDAMKDESRGGTSTGHGRLRNALVIAEIAISLVLLAGAGLMLESLRALLHQNPGFDLTHVLTFSVNLPDASYPQEPIFPFRDPTAVRFEHTFTQQLRDVPGVVDVAMATGVPTNGGSGSIRFVVEGRPKPTGQEDECDILGISTGYFSTLKIPLVAGRFFNENDGPDAPWVVMVNRAFVKTYLPNENPLGKRIRFTFSPKSPFQQIVGVVADTAQADLAAAPPPIIYVANDQSPTTFLSYLVRTAGDPAAFVGAARKVLHKLDPQLPMIQPQTLEQFASQSPSVFLRRYPTYLIGTFAILALILATIGLYGLISYTILQRTREIGIRMTMGAQRSDILRLVLTQGITTALIGTGIGVVAGLGLTRLLSSLLYGVNPGDWFTFAMVALLPLVVAMAACFVPARRAMGVDPVIALRHE